MRHWRRAVWLPALVSDDQIWIRSQPVQELQRGFQSSYFLGCGPVATQPLGEVPNDPIIRYLLIFETIQKDTPNTFCRRSKNSAFRPLLKSFVLRIPVAIALGQGAPGLSMGTDPERRIYRRPPFGDRRAGTSQDPIILENESQRSPLSFGQASFAVPNYGAFWQRIFSYIKTEFLGINGKPSRTKEATLAYQMHHTSVAVDALAVVFPTGTENAIERIRTDTKIRFVTYCPQSLVLNSILQQIALGQISLDAETRRQAGTFSKRCIEAIGQIRLPKYQRASVALPPSLRSVFRRGLGKGAHWYGGVLSPRVEKHVSVVAPKFVDLFGRTERNQQCRINMAVGFRSYAAAVARYLSGGISLHLPMRSYGCEGVCGSKIAILVDQEIS